MLKEALFWEKSPMGKTVRCQLCMRKCVIEEGNVGWCQTRLHQDGKLYSITYGQVASMSVSPIENKNMYHFFPGSLWFSVGSLGCNFRCHGCLNWDTANCDVPKNLKKATYLSPEMLVKKAKTNRCKGIAFTYNEPTMWFEYVYDVCKLAKEEGLATCFVTNGFLAPQALQMLSKYLDGFCLDLKGGLMDSYARIVDVSDINIIFVNGSDAKRKYAMHVEVTTNVVPGFNSSDKEAKEIAAWIYAELGKDTPWHLTQFFPYGEMKEISPTPISMLEGLREIGVKEGLLYVYVGNVPGHNFASTFCQKCKKVVIKRKEFEEIENKMVEGHCPHCGAVIFGRFSG